MKVFYLDKFGSWGGFSSFVLKEINLKEIFDYLDDSRKKCELLQIVDADKVCGSVQIISSIYRAYRAFSTAQNIARDLSIEFLIRLSGKRQISDAIKMLGVGIHTRNAVVVCADKDLGKVKNIISDILEKFSKKEDENLLEIYSKEKEEILKKIYEIKSPFIIKEILMKISNIEIQL